VGVLIDSSILVRHGRSRGPDVERYVSGREEEPFYLSVITVSELLRGVHRADWPLRRARRSAFVEAVIDRFPILSLDVPTARIHGEIGAKLAATGQPMGTQDLWLSASALAHGLTLVTTNAREFERVPGLDLEVWFEGEAI
jgi:tRNA(fMet)-specific endonuclease VapC